MKVDAGAPIGREHLLADLLGELKVRAPVLVLEGEPGVGKTTVWAALIDQVSAPFRWSARCVEAEVDLGLAVLADFFAAVPDAVVDELPLPQRRAVEIVLYRREPDPGEGPIAERLVGTATASMLQALARQGRVLMAIDDLQWCDAGSLRAIAFALHRVHDDLLFVANARPGHVFELPRQKTVAVAPLADSAIRDLVRSAARELPKPAVDDITLRCAGNPYFAVEMSRAVTRGDDPEHLPGSLRAALAERLAGLPPACMPALLEIAVRGTAPVAQFVDLDLDPAYRLGVLVSEGERVRFGHPLLSSALLESSSPVQVRAAHGRAAAAQTDMVSRALHRARAEQPSDELAQALDQAAEVARHRGDPYGARVLARLALAGAADGRRPPDRLLRLANLEHQLLNHASKAALARELSACAETPTQRFQAGFMLAAELSDHLQAARQLLDAARLEGITTAQEALAIRDAADRLRIVGRLDAAEHLLIDWLDRHVEPSAARVSAVAELCYERRLGGRTVDMGWLEREIDAARTAGEPDAEFSTQLTMAGILAYLDDRLADAHRLFAASAEGATTAGDLFLGAWYVGLVACRAGQLTEAIDDLTVHVETEVSYHRILPVTRLAHALSWRGEHERATRLLDAVAPHVHDDDDLYFAEIEFARGFNLLCEGRHVQAWPPLREACERLERVQIREPLRPPALAAAVECAAVVGDFIAADELCARLAAQSEALASRGGHAATLCCRGYLALAHHEPSEQFFAAAAGAYQELGVPLEEARARLALGSALRRAGHRTRARVELNRAKTLFVRSGADGFVRATEQELGRLGGRTAVGANSLTSAEEHVVNLVVTGMRNTDVARALHLSIKTVETHLGRVYRKLGVSNRAELVARFGGQPTFPAQNLNDATKSTGKGQ